MTLSAIVRTVATVLAAIGMTGLMATASQSQSSPSTASPSTASPPTTLFECVRQQPSGYATVARRGDRVTPPMIVWTSSLGGFTPQERCGIVSARLTRAVAGVEGGKLKNLKLTYGRINQAPVICYVHSETEDCTNNNLLFTLRSQDLGREDLILRQIVTFSVNASGSPVQQSLRQYYAPLGEAVEDSLGADATAPAAPTPTPAPSANDSGI